MRRRIRGGERPGGRMRGMHRRRKRSSSSRLMSGKREGEEEKGNRREESEGGEAAATTTAAGKLISSRPRKAPQAASMAAQFTFTLLAKLHILPLSPAGQPYSCFCLI